ncbi:MAG: TRAP transporter large permease [Variovorax sp.]|nr:MAG: TRAP transporter large permease [Variovorax sp.]
MDPIVIGMIGVAIMIVLLVLGVPIAFAMAVVGIGGTAMVAGLPQTLSQVTLVTWDKGTDFIIVCIPLFIFMGQLTATTGIAADLYQFLQRWMGRMRGGLGIASVFACGGFGAVTGSSVACVATMGTIVYPEMKRYGYDPRLATGVLAASGTLGILIPPSLAFAFYGTLTDTSIAALFIAGIVPGIITMLIFAGIVWVRCLINPALGPIGPSFTWQEKFASLRGILPIAIIFALVIGTLYGGVCTPTEASAIGAAGVVIVSLVMRRLTWANLRKALWETGLVSAFIFAIIVGGYLISRFLAITQVTDLLVNYVTVLNPSKLQFIGFMVVMYLVLGAILDVFGMTILTLPFIFPITTALGIDPIWLGVFIVIMTEVALITPPVGVNVFVMRGIATDVPMGQIFRGVMPFLVGEFVLIGLLVAFPAIATWLPQMMK